MTEVLGPWRQRISKDHEIDKKWSPEVMAFLQKADHAVTVQEVAYHLHDLEGYGGDDPRHLTTPVDHILGWLMKLGAVAREKRGRSYYYDWQPGYSAEQTSPTTVVITIIVEVR